MKRSYFIFLVLVCMSFPVLAQITGVEILGGKKKMDIPFRYSQGFILLDIKFQDKLPLTFVFDTGAEHTLLFKKEFSDALGLRYDKRIKIVGSDLSRELFALITRNVFLQLEGTKRVKRDIIVLEEDWLNMEEIVGTKIDGILGGEFFKGLVIKINYKKGKLTFYNPKYFTPPDDEEYREIPINIYKNKPYVPATIKRHARDSSEVNLLLDTGAAVTVLFHSNTDSILTIPENVIEGNIAKGLGGDMKGYIGMTEHFRVGEFVFNRLISNFQALELSVVEKDQIVRNGLIGNLLLERFELIINYEKEILYIKPTKKYNKAFEYDKSGLSIYAAGKYLDDYFINYVVPGSPADIVGIQPGDQIKKIGCWPLGFYDLRRITNKLNGKDGKKIKMKVKRNGIEYKVEFRLRDFFKEQ